MVIGNKLLVFGIKELQVGSSQQEKGHLGDSQTLSYWSSKIFFGGSNVIFVPSLYYFWPKKRFFCLLVGFFNIKKT